jgi:amino acid transporter
MSTQQLKSNCLSYTELLAQAVALISPTMTAALIIPVMYSNTGDWSWLSYALGTVMLLFVAFNLNQFARRSTMAGSMYAYICRGLGFTAGAIGGWSLIWAYLGIAMPPNSIPVTCHGRISVWAWSLRSSVSSVSSALPPLVTRPAIP